MKDRKIGLLIIALISLAVIFAIDFVAIPLILKTIISWFGVALSFGQCLIITLFFNVITYSFRKKG